MSFFKCIWVFLEWKTCSWLRLRFWLDVGVVGDFWDVLVGGDCCVGCWLAILKGSLKFLPMRKFHVDNNILLGKWLEVLLLMQRLLLPFLYTCILSELGKSEMWKILVEEEKRLSCWRVVLTLDSCWNIVPEEMVKDFYKVA